MSAEDIARVREILATVKPLAARLRVKIRGQIRRVSSAIDGMRRKAKLRRRWLYRRVKRTARHWSVKILIRLLKWITIARFKIFVILSYATRIIATLTGLLIAILFLIFVPNEFIKTGKRAFQMQVLCI
jgi:hypothetical protein